jgi:hypothetical protein
VKRHQHDFGEQRLPKKDCVAPVVDAPLTAEVHRPNGSMEQMRFELNAEDKHELEKLISPIRESLAVGSKILLGVAWI